jgi:HPt (histidine-containing phosphotransfer) domain-containing protein
MTANALQGDRESCLAAGMDDYLSKPIDVGALVAALARCTPTPAAPAPDAPDTPASRPALDPPVVLDQAALDGLLEATGADPAFLAALIGAYLADTPAQLETMAAAAAGGDAEALRRTAHSLKASSATLGALALAARCRELEAMGGDGRLDGAPALVAAAAAAYSETRQALQAADPRVPLAQPSKSPQGTPGTTEQQPLGYPRHS